jgi:hypothetical protein
VRNYRQFCTKHFAPYQAKLREHFRAVQHRRGNALGRGDLYYYSIMWKSVARAAPLRPKILRLRLDFFFFFEQRGALARDRCARKSEIDVSDGDFLDGT